MRVRTQTIRQAEGIPATHKRGSRRRRIVRSPDKPALGPRPVSADVSLSFARHETFHPRFGWIKKGFDAVCSDPVIFQREDAPTILGVGKNMVRAIRYWCLAFKVIAETDRRAAAAQVTELGRVLLSDDGYDPYLEDTGSLWLLHWNLLQPPCKASAWHFTFSLYPQIEFTVDDLVAELQEWQGTADPNSRVMVSSLRKDAHCIIRMYGESPQDGSITEESIHCPFAELGLMRAAPKPRRTFAFNLGAKAGLSSNLIAATSLEFAANHSLKTTSISLRRLLRGEGSPGMCFKLTEDTLYDALEQASAVDSRIRLTDTAGVIQLSIMADPFRLAADFRKRHYSSPPRRIST